MMCGGVNEAKDVTEEVIKICEDIKKELEEKTGKTFDTYKPLKYATQVVAGTNYFVKIYVKTKDGEDHIHVRIFRSLPCHGETKLHGFQEGKTEHDKVVHF